MCGIAGIVMRDPERQADARTARKMADSMFHRGPDGSGLWQDGPVALAHRRLKIIDLSSRADQPMRTADGRFTIVYNGEIYNYRELRQDLISQGAWFVSSSDTEVLLQLVARHGAAALERLNGIFAFAVWDSREQNLFAARDPFGVKPFYYATDGDRLLFASEVKALLEAGFPARAEPSTLGELVIFGAVAGERTLFQGVQRLLPGGWLRFQVRSADQGPSVGRYFDPLNLGQREAIPTREAVARVRAAVQRAVETQMVSDVPVGSMCSGGLDSSAVTAFSAQVHRGIHTFCVGIDSPESDESAFGQRVAEHCRTVHHQLDSRPGDIADLLPTLVWLHDEPLRHPNSLAIFQVSRLARDFVVVLLSGEGSDEVFGGYGSYGRARLVNGLRRLMPLARTALGRLPLTWVTEPRLQRAWSAISAAGPGAFLVELQRAVPSPAAQILFPELPVDAAVRMSLAERSWLAARADPVQAALLYDQVTHLPTLLDRQDKMCMGASIESRVPFLDLDVVRLANQLPAAQKLRWRTSKYVLRQALRDVLPPEVRRRPKFPFALPLRRWMYQRDGFDPAHLLEKGELVRSGLVQRRTLERLQRDPALADVAWNVLNLEIWWQVFITRALQPRLSELPARRTSTPPVNAMAWP